ncbi:ribonuclease HII [Vagococcus sp. BWB3-3]|uniref:Ribonuclease HII n=1 Tax=Vagococcus allomyrinae TaxID=2794353 RepID=A0A940SVC6_9ENTE|nr:ribonuclease HII [Vagococcus allomyrinae]MBP1041714.1 ribonuclease HII [Vagococcus allomyrinae]
MTKPASITEIKGKLAQIHQVDDPYILALEQDSRKGVVSLLATFHKRLARVEAMRQEAEMLREFERRALQQGYQVIAGIDEVGRGPLAGPVIAAAVILPNNCEMLEVNDSKKLSEKKRDFLFTQICETAVAVGIGIVDEQTIDQINIYQATKLAMKEAIEKLSFTPDYLLLDAMKLEAVPIAQESIIKGDAKSVSIAAASIVAKVTRDRLMKEYGEQYPGYGFENNAGYGTKEHLAGLDELGPCPIHRKTFAPVKYFFA